MTMSARAEAFAAARAAHRKFEEMIVKNTIQAAQIRKGAGSFAELMAATEMADWLPQALNALADVVLAALHNTGPELTPQIRATVALEAFDEFAAAGKERVATAIGKRAGVRKGLESIW